MKGDFSRGHQPDRKRSAAKGVVTVALSAVFLILLSTPMGILPPIGGLANPGGGIWVVGEGAAHPIRQEISFPELQSTVTVYRDRLGIPHIFAANEHDLFFAQGYVHAQDRLWQMDVTRRVGLGELAEAFGPSIGDLDVVELDTFIRTIGLPHLARTFAAETDPAAPYARAAAAYAEGVNAYLRVTGTLGLPLEFKLLNYGARPWTTADSLAVGLYLTWSLSGTFEDLDLSLIAEGIGIDAVNELFPIEGPFQRPVDPHPGTKGGGLFGEGFGVAARDVLAKESALTALIGSGPLFGSNNWAVAGNRTDTGKPRLANDPHLSFQLPAIWYENHLVGGGFDVYGVSLPGVPTVVLGQNRNIAWGATNVGGDVIDLYRETVDGDRYLFEGSWRDLDVRPETIRVKGGEPIALTVRSTVHGPLVTERGQTLAMRWTGTEGKDLLRAFYEINRAGDWTDFTNALQSYTVAAQNFVYADTAGHIGIRSNGLYPIRNFDARFVAEGATGMNEWTGFVPFDEYPQAFDPDEGYVLSANQQPQHDGYPYYMGWSWDPGYRARRIAEIFEADDRVTADDLAAMQLDTLDVMAREFTPYVVRAVSGNCASAACTSALAATQAWDFRMDPELAAPAIWWRFANHLREQMFTDEWQAAGIDGLLWPFPNVMEDLLKNDPDSPWWDDVRTAARETWDDIVRRAWGFAVDDLVAELGPSVSTWRWGDVHHRTFAHLTALGPLSRGPFRSGGSTLTVNVAPGDLASAGPSWRLLADLSDLTKSRGVYPGGQSGNPLNPHYDDLLALWLDGEYHDFVLPMSAATMPANAVESTLILRGA